MDRVTMAKNLASLLPATARVATEAALEGFKKAPLFKAEMEKPALFETRRRMHLLLPKERRPEANTNWSLVKAFFLKALAPKSEKKPAFKKQQGGQKRKHGGKQPQDKPKQTQGQNKAKKMRMTDLAEKRCFFCHAKGHLAADCEKRKAKENGKK